MRLLFETICVVWMLPSLIFAEDSRALLANAVVAGDGDAIINLADSTRETDALYASAQLLKAIVLAEKQRYDDSISAYSKVISAAPEDAVEAYMGRSMVKRMKGDQKGADADVEQVKMLREEGKSLYRRQLNQRLAEKPKNIAALLARALNSLNAEAYESAIRDFDAYIEIVADNSMAYASKAHAQDLIDDKEGAVATCTDWLVALPGSAEAYQLRARLRRSAGDEQGSIRDLLAYQSVVRETKRQAVMDLGETIEKNPNLSFGYYERARLYMELGKLQEAEVDLDKAAKLEPESNEVKWLRNDLKKKKETLTATTDAK